MAPAVPDTATVVARYAGGESIASIARHYRVANGVISTLLYREGVRIRSGWEQNALTAARRRLAALRETDPDAELPPPLDPHPPIPRAVFGELVAALAAELKTASRERFTQITSGGVPDTFQGRPWVSERIGGQAAAELCGLSYRKTWREYQRRAKRAREHGGADPRHAPPAGKDGLWKIGRLAVWQAVKAAHVLDQPRGLDHSSYLPAVRAALAEPGGTSRRRLARELGVAESTAAALMREAGWEPGTPVHAQALPLVRAMVRKSRGVPLRAQDVEEELTRAGLEIRSRETIYRLIRETGGAGLARMEPDTLGTPQHPGGLVRPITVARAAGVEKGAISGAISRGELVVAAHDKWGPLLDPKRIRAAPGMRRTPVDVDWKPPSRRRCPQCGRTLANCPGHVEPETSGA